MTPTELQISLCWKTQCSWLVFTVWCRSI